MGQLSEYLSKKLLARFGLPVESGILAGTSDQAAEAVRALGSPVVIKAQLPVGGRGKAGAIRRADSPEEAVSAFQAVTAIRFGELQACEVLVDRWQQCASEYYLGVVADAELAWPVVLFSAGGGVDVEAAGGVRRIPLREDGSMPAAILRQAAYAAGVPAQVVERLIGVAHGLVRAYFALDARLVEVNPLGLKEDGRLIALDARLIVDDHALFRQPELLKLSREMRPRRREEFVREETRLEFVQLDGWLGLISGGAGMTMAAMDLIADLGGEPACFLDCSNNPTPEGYGAALDLLLEDPRVRAILISIFGGLTLMDRVARTLVKLFAERDIRKPITLRLMGTNGEVANAILREAGLKNHGTLEEAVAAAVASVATAGGQVEAVS